jgi:hypothetical protein
MVAPIIWVSGLVASMAGYANAIVNHLSGKNNREHQKDLQKDALADRQKDREQAAKHHQELLAFQKENAKNQLDTILQSARIQSQATLAIPELNKKYANWPLLTVPSDILEQHLKDTQPPLLVMPVFQGFGDDDLSTIPTQFLQTHYKRSGDRPVEVLDHNWLPHIPIGGGSIKAIFSAVKSQPCLFVLVQRSKDKIKLRIAGWGFNPPFAFDEIVIPDSSGQELLRFYAKQQARAWEKEREKYFERGYGKSLDEIDKNYNAKAAYNLGILKEQEALEANGCDANLLNKAYRVDDDEAIGEQAATVIAKCSALWCAFFTDMHYLLYNNLPPQLPRLLPELTEGIAGLPIIQDSIREILACYRATLDEMKAIRSALVPDLALEMAKALATIKPEYAEETLNYVAQAWQESRTGMLVANSPISNLIQDTRNFVSGLEQIYKQINLIEPSTIQNEIKSIERKIIQQTVDILHATHLVTEPIIKEGKLTLQEKIVYVDKYPVNLFGDTTTTVYSRRICSCLEVGDWKGADRETYDFLRKLLPNKKANEPFYPDDIKKLCSNNLYAIDFLWRYYSNNRFGYSIQKDIYASCGAKIDSDYPGDTIWKAFAERVGWRVDGAWINTGDLIFDIKAPKGHLPGIGWGWQHEGFIGVRSQDWWSWGAPLCFSALIANIFYFSTLMANF